MEVGRRACRLDHVLMLVSPGNPLKEEAGYLPLGERLLRARLAARGRAWISVSDAEARLGTRFTADTLAALKLRAGGRRLVWIMGADSLASFHRWRDWRRIAHAVPILVVSRPGEGPAALASPAARALWRSKVPAARASSLPRMAPPAWCYLPTLHDPSSATAIRAKRP
jgi:nicotinate-nucleotide adenylyltransferase